MNREAATSSPAGIGGRVARRRFLALAAVVPAGLAACTQERSDATGGSGERGETPDVDLDSLEFAASLEVAAEAAYRRILDEVTAGRLGDVPAAGSELLESAADQHRQSAAAVAALLESAGRTTAIEADAEFESSTVAPAVAAAKAWPDVAVLARTIETAVSATYLRAIQSTLQSPRALRLAGGIQATAQKRIAVLNFMLGEYPVPDTFQKTDAALAR